MSNWGGANRPITSNKLGSPNPREGIDGDIQIRQTELGAKLFGKLGGRWHDSPLSIDGETKIGKNLSDYLAINRDSIDIYTDDVKVATFGETTTVKDINLTGKIAITSIGTANVCMGVDNSDVSGSTHNVLIGVEAGSAMESGGTHNTCIGYQAGAALTTGNTNVCIGSFAGKSIIAHNANVCIGNNAGASITTGYGNVYVGMVATASGSGASNEVVIAGNLGTGTVIGNGNNTVTIGSPHCTDVFISQDSGATVHCTSITLKETTTPTALANSGKIYTKTDNKLYFQDGAGSEHEISFA